MKEHILENGPINVNFVEQHLVNVPTCSHISELLITMINDINVKIVARDSREDACWIII